MLCASPGVLSNVLKLIGMLRVIPQIILVQNAPVKTLKMAGDETMTCNHSGYERCKIMSWFICAANHRRRTQDTENMHLPTQHCRIVSIKALLCANYGLG